MAAVLQPTLAPERKQFYDKIDTASVAPLWEVLHNLVTKQPKTPCVPAHWKWSEMQPWLMEAGRLITAEEAERRVLVLENPGLRGRAAITHSLYAGLQLILPGEIAAAHRHTQSALRFVLDGRGAYTSVDGERVFMSPGDFIITPSWTWHDHGNPGSEPVVWIDGLDINIVQLFGAQFMEVYPEESQPVTRAEGDSVARYGHNLVPLGPLPASKTSPIFNYPYARSREALATLARNGPPDPCHGWKMQYINPLTGGHAMPTIGAFVQLLPEGFSSSAARSTDTRLRGNFEGQRHFARAKSEVGKRK